MKRMSFIRCFFATRVLMGLALIFSSSSYGATFVFVKKDSPNEGLFDQRSVSPVGGNAGTTLGTQRRKVFKAAFSVLENTIQSDVSIKVRVSFDPLPCSKYSGMVGGGGPMSAAWDFEGAPEPDVLYPIALANQHAGLDLEPDTTDIEIIINRSVDFNNNCLTQTNFYYGLDGKEPQGTINLFSIILHEVIHGLGFLSLTDIDGSFLFDIKDQFSQYIYDTQYNKYWPEMTNTQRADSYDNSYSVTWRAPEIVFRGKGISGGATSENHWNGMPLIFPYLYAPSPVEPASSISHWKNITPDQLMEPYATKPIVKISDYERTALLDIGWPLTQPLPVIDFDGDGVRDRDDHFPWDSNESQDNDGDRIGDNGDTDDDNDGMDDEWELSVGLDPLVDDAEEDPDEDNWTNAEEYVARTNPHSNQSIPEPLTFYYDNFSNSLPASWFPFYETHPYAQSTWFAGDGRLNATPTRNSEHYTIQFGALFPEGAQVRFSLDVPIDCDKSVSITIHEPGSDKLLLSGGKGTYDIQFEVTEGLKTIRFLASQRSSYIAPECTPEFPITIDDFYVLTPEHDQDGDGIPDLDELDNGLNPLDADDAILDADSDGLTNVDEFIHSTGINIPDSDEDGLLDGDEIHIHSSNPLSTDTDGDGMRDAWEIANNLSPNDESDANEDSDNDGFTNYYEYIADTNPTAPNSKPIKISTYTENFVDDSYLGLWKSTPEKTSFISVDSDSYTGLKSIQSTSNEYSEINIIADFDEGLLSFMLNVSTKGFFLLVDGEKAQNLHTSTNSGWKPNSYFIPAGIHRLTFANYDPLYIPCETQDLACRLANSRNPQPGVLNIDTAKFVPAVGDTDTDGMSDTFENNYELDSGINDSNLDLDVDGFSNLEEFLANTHPNDPISFPSSALPQEGDVDGDGLNNDDEVNLYSTDPENRDSDGDLISDNWEIQYGLNPLDSTDANRDEDNDGYSNLEEFGGNSNPLLGASIPQESLWQTYQGDAQHTGYVPITINTATATERWSKNVFSDSPLHPVVTIDGKVFVSSDTRFGTQKLSALNLTNGTELWQHNFGNIHRVSGPAISEGKIFIQTGGHSDSFLYGFEALSGNIQIQSSYVDQWSRFIAPTPFGNNVYIQGGGAHSFNTITGGRNWLAALPPRDNWAPAVNDSHLFVCLGAELTALNRQTGLRAYGIPTSACNATHPTNTTSPVIGADANALVIGFGDLVHFNLAEQSINWIRRRGGYTGMPSIGVGLAAAITNGALAVHNEKDGSLLWYWTPPTGDLIGNPVLTNSHIFVSTNDTTYAINLQTHEQEWSYGKGGHIVISTGHLYISSSDGTLSVIAFDTDADGIIDSWEMEYGLDPKNPADATEDLDGDNLTNLQEFQEGSNPTLKDTDGDTISDYDEVLVHATSPIKQDTDNDGMPDNWELDNGFDPLDPSDAATDADADGVTNLEEFNRGTSPVLADSDGDNLTDYDEITNHGTNPTSSDSDGDGIDDGFEITNGLNPLIQDSSTDLDNDGFSNLEEFITGNNPSDASDKPAKPDLTFGTQLCSINADAVTASIHPQSDKVYVPNRTSNTIDIITVTRVGCVSKSVPVSGEPQDVAFSEDGNKYFVTIASVAELHVYDSETDQLTNAIALPAIGYEVVAGGGTIYVSASNTSEGIMRINTETELYIDSFDSGSYTYYKGALELSPNAERLFFGTLGETPGLIGVSPGTLEVYDVTGGTPLLLNTTYPASVLGPDGRSLSVDPINGNFVSYATAGQYSFGSVTNEKIYKLPSEDFFAPLGHFLTGPSAKVIEYSHNGIHAYTVNTSDEIKVWNANQFTLEETFTISGEARDVVESWSQRYLVAATDEGVQILHLNSGLAYKPNSWWRFQLMLP